MIRPYQNDCVGAIAKEFEQGVNATLAVLPTGCGKTTLAAEFIRRVQPARCLFFANRDLLIYQARETIERISGVKCGIEMAELQCDRGLFSKDQVVISTVQTQNAGNAGLGRMQLFRPTDFEYLFVDECFPAGTLVDGVPIETIRIGDKVWSCGDTLEQKRVTRRFKNKVGRLVKITFASGREMVVTPNHPIFSINAGNYIPAGMLTGDSVVFRLITNEPEMLRMWKTGNPKNKIRTLSGFFGTATLLFPIMRAHSALAGVCVDFGRNKSKIRLGENEAEQPYVPTRDPGKDVCDFAENRPPTHFSGWQWARSNKVRGGIIRSVILEHQCESSDAYAERFGLSRLLQTGCWPSSIKDRSGNRWSFAFLEDQATTGQQEGRFFTLDRVESVEVLEPGSDGTFGGMCSNGFVYNIEVEDNHNYFAEGVLTHNCHHWVAPSYLKLVRYFQQNPRLKVIGLTATPDRLDKESLGQLFQTTAYRMDILDAIADGWLVGVKQQFVPVSGLDFTHITTTAGDLNLGQLSAVMEEEETVQRMIQPTLEACFTLEPHRLDYAEVNDWGAVIAKHGAPKRTLVFCTSVKQAQRFAEVMNRVTPGMAAAVWDKVSKQDRRNLFTEFRAGRLQVLVNVGICGEGFDVPEVEIIVMGRATKSRSLYAQFLGRGLRPQASIAHELNSLDAAGRCELIARSAKPKCLVLDFVGNAGRHKLITSADILGGKVSAKALDIAKKKLLNKPEGADVTQTLLDAEEEMRKRMEKAKKDAESRRVKLVARSKYTKVDIDPFDALDLMPTKPKAFDSGKKLSEKQVALMARFGIDASKYPYTQAKQLFIELCNRLKARKATPPQAAVLKRAGYENAADLPQKEAKRLIDNLRNNGWKRPVTKIAPENELV